MCDNASEFSSSTIFKSSTRTHTDVRPSTGNEWWISWQSEIELSLATSAIHGKLIQSPVERAKQKIYGGKIAAEQKRKQKLKHKNE